MNMVSSQIYFILWKENGFWLAVDPEHFWYKGECLPFCTEPNVTRRLILISFPWSHKHDLRHAHLRSAVVYPLTEAIGSRSMPLLSHVRLQPDSVDQWCVSGHVLPTVQGKDMRTNFLVMLGACAIPLSRLGGMSAAYSVSWWLNLIRDYCWCLLKKRNCIYHTGYDMRHNSSEMLTVEVPQRESWWSITFWMTPVQST